MLNCIVLPEASRQYLHYYYPAKAPTALCEAETARCERNNKINCGCKPVWLLIQPRLLVSSQHISMLLLLISRRGKVGHSASSLLLKSRAMAKNDVNKDADILKWANQKGEFVRKPATFRNWVTKDGPFQPERDRYHLYVSYACPWAHRTLIVRKLKGLEDLITVNVVDYFMGEKGWRFNPDVDGCTPDTIHGFSHIREVYFKVEPEYSGRFTVPVLYDKKMGKIVNNESSEIIRMLNAEFNALSKNPQLDLYPEDLRAEIDAVNEWIYRQALER